jgi:hypothetical protein
MGLSGAIGDAWEILANVVGKRGYPGSCSESAADPGCGTSGAGLGTGGVAA